MAHEERSEIYRLLRIGETIEDEHAGHAEPKIAPPIKQSGPIVPGFTPGDLPIVDFESELTKSLADQVVDSILNQPIHQNQATVDAGPRHIIMPQIPGQANARESKPGKGFFKGLLLYPVIFVISFAFFYVLFNFSSLVSQVNAWFVKSEDEEVLKEDLAPFYKWMEGYYFAVDNKQLLEPNNDIDKDGLSNLDEFIARTNPTISDSDSDGDSDGTEIMNSTNPWGRGGMTSAQLKLREQMDIIKINNRISFNTVSIADQAQVEPKIAYDLSKPGRLSIPRLSMQVPLVWTASPAEFDVDLTKGVVHYPGTALPGEKGTMYVSGHSSDYFWKNHPYKQIFAKINILQPGDDIFVDIYGLDGKTYNYRYKVSEKNIFKPDDQAQFIDNSDYKLNLSTCWPIGTQRDRYVVSATLVPL